MSNLPTGLVAVACLSVASLSAQGFNSTLLSRFDPAGQTYNDVWGYVSPSGGEYAIVGTHTGAFILDCTDPTNPLQRGFISAASSGWNSSTWRDMRTYGNYLYIVTEGGGGVQIVDMSNPDQPHLLKTWGKSIWADAHNVALDTQRGVLYPCGTNVGMPICDLADPVNPVLITTLRSPYVHDLHVQDGLAHLAEINNARYAILDVTGLPSTTQLSSISKSSCHNIWPTRDNNFAVATSETSNGDITIFDISNNRLPRRLASWRTGRNGTSVHNAFVRDRVVHASYYSEGYQCLDISNPAKPVKVASYDTSSATTGYSGDWGLYPFQPSGVIYATDQSNGLFVLSSKASAGRYGDATDTGNNAAPAIHAFGAAFLGNSNFMLEVDGAAANAQVTWLIGTASAATNVAGIGVNVDLNKPWVSVSANADAAGHGQLALPLPAGIAQGTLYAQAFTADALGPLGHVATRGLRFEVFRLE